MDKASKEQMKRINSLNLSPPAGSEVPESDVQLSQFRRTSRRTAEKQIAKFEKYRQELRQQQQHNTTTTEQEEAKPTERRIADSGVPEVRGEEAARR